MKQANKQAVEFNAKVKNVYGKNKFIVYHSGGIFSRWFANNRKHLDLLLRMELNMGYMLSIDNVVEL